MSLKSFDVKYVESGSLTDREISKHEAENAASYCTYFYLKGILHHVELVQEGDVIIVYYKDHSWPDAELMAWHKQTYPDIPYEVQTPVEEQDGELVRDIYGLNSFGELLGRSKQIFDDQGDVVIEDRMTAQGELLERTEYVYDGEGEDRELIITRVYGSDGELYEEIDETE